MLRPVTAKEIPVVQMIFQTSWALVKQYENITEADDQEWQELCRELNMLNNLGGIDSRTAKLSKGIALAVADYLEAEK